MPIEQQYVKIFGKTIDTPMRYNIYGISYEFSGQKNIANPEIPEILQPFYFYLLVTHY